MQRERERPGPGGITGRSSARIRNLLSFCNPHPEKCRDLPKGIQVSDPGPVFLPVSHPQGRKVHRCPAPARLLHGTGFALHWRPVHASSPRGLPPLPVLQKQPEVQLPCAPAGRRGPAFLSPTSRTQLRAAFKAALLFYTFLVLVEAGNVSEHVLLARPCPNRLAGPRPGIRRSAAFFVRVPGTPTSRSRNPKRKEAKNLLKVTQHGSGGAGTEIQAGSSNTPRRDILPLKG